MKIDILRLEFRSLWDYWSSDLYEFTQFHARDKDKLFQQGFLAEHPTPASRLQDWIDIPLKSFFALRGLEDMFHSPNACAPPCPGDIHAGGSWVYCKKIDVDEEEILRGNAYEEAHHGTSLNCLCRIVARGLSLGWARICDSEAIYLHPVKDAGKCMGYAMYTHLFQDGVYVAIKFRVASMRYGRALKGRKVTIPRARGVKQWLTYPDCHHVLGFWVHILQQHELFQLYPNSMGPVISRRWQPEIELHPLDTDEAMRDRSRIHAERRREQRRILLASAPPAPLRGIWAEDSD
jgi:hypothetical protein